MSAGTSWATAEERSAQECATIESASERLACFDAQYGKSKESVRAAPPTGDDVDKNKSAAAAGTAAATTAVDKSATSTDDDFGFTKPKQETEGESLTSGISAVSKDAYRRLVFELDNGQVWRQIEYKRFTADAGDVTVIRHGSFGSYKLYIEGTKPWTRVRRVR